MELTLPKKLNHPENIIVDSKRIVIIGANGSGKTRFGTDIERRYNNQTHRISAQKSLTMPKNVSPTSKESAEKDFLYGYVTGSFGNKNSHRWGSKPNTHLLNDFQKLMVLLHTEEYEESIKFKEAYIPGQGADKPITKLDRKL
jgi:recombinational DNA repair ATPase RecF